jgi:hypothetical protein
MGHIGLTVKRLYLARKTYAHPASVSQFCCYPGVELKARVTSTNADNTHTVRITLPL